MHLLLGNHWNGHVLEISEMLICIEQLWGIIIFILGTDNFVTDG